MPVLSMRSFRVILLVLLGLSIGGNLSAALRWTADGGWTVEGGAFSGLAGQDVQRATELMNKARAAEERGNKGSAMRMYKKVAKRFPNSVFAPEALYRQGHLRISRKQYYKGFEAFQTVMSLYPNIARTHQRLNNTPYAIDALDRLINNYSQSLLAPDAYLALAQTHASLVDGPAYDQESTREAITYFEDFMILFPDDPGLSEAQHGLDQMRTVFAESKMILGNYQLKYNKNFQAARVFYNEAITSFPDSEVADRARAQLEVVQERMDEQGLIFDEDGKLAVAEGVERPTKRKKFLGIF